ncbi:hypothetical protein WJX82_001746 [Trebouxia sp. C0006]
MGPHVTSPGQEATNLSSAADVESPRLEKKKMCFGVVGVDLANDAAVTAGVPFNPTSGNPSSDVHTLGQDQMMMDARVALDPSDVGKNENDFDVRGKDIPMPPEGFLGILTGKSKGSADLLNCALADLLEPETPEQFEAELFEDMFSLLPEGDITYRYDH